jgi:hypothetical protein
MICFYYHPHPCLPPEGEGVFMESPPLQGDKGTLEVKSRVRVKGTLVAKQGMGLAA